MTIKRGTIFVTRVLMYVVTYVHLKLLNIILPDAPIFPMREILMDSISPTLMANHVPMVDNSSIVKCLLYGVNSVILKATLKFMDDTEHFVWLLPVLLFSWCTVYSPLLPPPPPIPFLFVNPKEHGYWCYHLLGQSIVLNLIFHSVFVKLFMYILVSFMFV